MASEPKPGKAWRPTRAQLLIGAIGLIGAEAHHTPAVIMAVIGLGVTVAGDIAIWRGSHDR